jgi:hypothetical protein
LKASWELTAEVEGWQLQVSPAGEMVDEVPAKTSGWHNMDTNLQGHEAGSRGLFITGHYQAK